MNLNNIIDVLFDIGQNKQTFRSLDKNTLLHYFKSNYVELLDKEIFRTNSKILENEIQTTNDGLILSKILFESKILLGELEFLNFLEACNFSNNESIFINDNLKNDSQETSIINLMKQLINTQSFSILKDYRESPQARKDIKNSITNKNISSSILNPFLTLLAEKNAPSIRMELWQKFEMYFESGWGFNDLTQNDSKSLLADKLKDIINQINNSENKITSSEGLGKDLLNTLSDRITELGVPIHIKMEKNPINGTNVPVATILKDKEKYKHAFKSKKTMPSGFVDWAMPSFNNPENLCCSLATSDETCNTENSEAFRYEYALRELSKNNDSGFKHISLFFYSTSTFYDEYDLDEEYYYHKPNQEIGKEFLSRFKVYKEQRRLLNIIPFFAMSHKISSNLKTGIYSPSQLMSYNFKILGAKSMIENSEYEIEEIYKRCINVILKVFNQDSKEDYYTDGKSLNMLNQLYNLITTSKDEFFESKKIFNLLTDEEILNSLNSILKKIPENQNNEKQINKNDFKTLIQSLKYIKAIGFNEYKEEQFKIRKEFLEDSKKLRHLTSLSKSIIYLQELDESIENILTNLNNQKDLKEYIKKSPKEQKLFVQNLLIDKLSYWFDGREKHDVLFKQNTTVLDYNYYKYLSDRSYVTANKHKKIFLEYQENKEQFLNDWKNNKIEINKENVIKMCFHFIKNINEHNFQEFKLPYMWYPEWNKNFNQLLNISERYNEKKIELQKQEQENNFQIENLKNEKEVVLKTIKEKYSNDEISFVLNKMNIDIPLLKEIKITPN